MRKPILQMQMSVDGFVAAVQPGLHWQIWNWGDPWPWDERVKRDCNAIFDAAGPVDEFRFFINPTAVSEGYSIFHQPREGFRLALLRPDACECGMVVNRYAAISY